MLYTFAFLLVSSKRKAFTDIHRNNGLIRLIMIQQRSSNCKSQLSHGPQVLRISMITRGHKAPEVIN